jgi:hypothetical protein
MQFRIRNVKSEMFFAILILEYFRIFKNIKRLETSNLTCKKFKKVFIVRYILLIYSISSLE